MKGFLHGFHLAFAIPVVAVIATLACQPPHEAGSGAAPTSDPPGSRPPRRPDLETERERTALLHQSERLRARERRREALALVSAGLRRMPDEALLHVEYGRLLREAGEVAEAETAFRRAVELNPDHVPAYRLLGDLAASRGAPGEAADHYGRCTSLDPDNADCRYGLGLALAELGDVDAAATELRAAAEELNSADPWAELGKVERRRRRLDAAIESFSRGLGRDRHHLASLLGLGQMLVATGREEIGRELLERHREEALFEDHLDAVRRAAEDPDADVEVLLKLADMYRRRDDPERAEATLREASKRAPGSVPATLALANHLVHQDEIAEAERLVAGLDPAVADDPATLFLRGTMALARGAEEEARAHFAASLAAGSWPALVYVDAGKAWAAAGFPERAADAFRRAVEGSPDSAEARLGLARSQRSLGLYGEALASVNRALELDPHQEGALLLRAVLELELGHPRRARDTFARTLVRRRLDLLPAGGADDLRRELTELDPPGAAVKLFEQELARYGADPFGDDGSTPKSHLSDPQ